MFVFLSSPWLPAKGACKQTVPAVIKRASPRAVPSFSSTHLLLIPTYNTGLKVMETVRGALEKWHPVWVVTDGSDDGTTAALVALAETVPQLRIIPHPRNLGK